MSTSNPQKEVTSKYEHNSAVFNKTIAGSEIGKTDFRLQTSIIYLKFNQSILDQKLQTYASIEVSCSNVTSINSRN